MKNNRKTMLTTVAMTAALTLFVGSTVMAAQSGVAISKGASGVYVKNSGNAYVIEVNQPEGSLKSIAMDGSKVSADKIFVNDKKLSDTNLPANDTIVNEDDDDDDAPAKTSKAPRTSEAPARTSEAPARTSEAPARTSEAPARTSEAPVAPSATPGASEDPAPSATPGASEDPAPSATPGAGEDPAPSATPGASEDPAPSATPGAGETPVEPSASADVTAQQAPGSSYGSVGANAKGGIFQNLLSFLAPVNAQAADGSTRIGLSAAYLDTLSERNHVVTVEFTAGSATANIQVVAAGTNAATGDNTMVWPYVVLAAFSAGVMVFLGRKESIGTIR